MDFINQNVQYGHPLFLSVIAFSPIYLNYKENVFYTFEN